jgi:hypothetical protein
LRAIEHALIVFNDLPTIFDIVILGESLIKQRDLHCESHLQDANIRPFAVDSFFGMQKRILANQQSFF